MVWRAMNLTFTGIIRYRLASVEGKMFKNPFAIVDRVLGKRLGCDLYETIIVDDIY